MIPESRHLESRKIYTLQKNRKRTFYKKSQKKFYIKFKKCIFTLWDIIHCFILKANNRQAQKTTNNKTI